MVIWRRTYCEGHLIFRKETCCCLYMGYSFRLVANVLSYSPSYMQDGTYHGLCYNSHGVLAGMRNSSMGPPRGINRIIHHIISGCSTTELHLAPKVKAIPFFFFKKKKKCNVIYCNKSFAMQNNIFVKEYVNFF